MRLEYDLPDILYFVFAFFPSSFLFQVSAVTDQVGAQELGGNTGDFDDDDGAGLVQKPFFCIPNLNKNKSLIAYASTVSGNIHSYL